MSLGILRVDELLCHIVEISLVNTGFQILAEVRGPQSACEGEVRLFTNEGIPVLDNVEGKTSRISIPEVLSDDIIRVRYVINIESIGASRR